MIRVFSQKREIETHGFCNTVYLRSKNSMMLFTLMVRWENMSAKPCPRQHGGKCGAHECVDQGKDCSLLNGFGVWRGPASANSIS